MKDHAFNYVGRYGDSNIHLVFCKDTEQLVQVEEIEDVNSPDAMLLNGFVVKIRDNQFSAIQQLSEKSKL